MRHRETARKGGWGVERGVRADMAVFVGGKGLSLFLSGFSLTLPLYLTELPLLFMSCVPFSLSPSSSPCASPAPSLSFLSQCVCCQLELNFLPGPYLFHPPTSPPRPSFHFVSYSHLSLPPFAASFNLIYLLLTASHVLFLYSPPLLLHYPPFSLPTIISVSLLPPSQLLPLSH